MKNTGRKINNLPHLKVIRKELRNNLTPAEARLWIYLKNSKLDGRKFRRQHSVLNFVLDFYCPSEKLAVELDGEVHNNEDQALYDNERTQMLNDVGIRVIRFENKLVFNNLDRVLEEIRQCFGSGSPRPPRPSGTPPSQGGE